MSFLLVQFNLNRDILKIQAKSDDLFAEVALRYLIEAGLNVNNPPKFFYKSSELVPEAGKTLSDYDIKNMSTIDVIKVEPIPNSNNNNNNNNSNNNNSFPESSDELYITKLLETENNELRGQLEEEKNKNKMLTKKIEELKKELEKSNTEIKKMKESNSSINLGTYYSINSINPGEKIIAVNFVSMGNQEINHYNLICKNVDLFVTLEARLYNDFPRYKEYNPYFTVNGRAIKRFKTMDENKIKNNDIISVFIHE